MKIRKANMADISSVHWLINDYARKEAMLPRSIQELYEHVRDFTVLEDKGKVRGVCALHVLWEDLAEIRSLALSRTYRNIGIGKKLIQRCISEAKSIGIKRVFVLTYHPDLFKKNGFEYVDKSELPQKIWGDCVRCPKFPDCDETALIRSL